MRSRHRERGGFVLLVVIAASVLVVTVLGTLAKISLRRAVDAADAVSSLQQRWGSLTLQRVLLTEAPKVFEAQEEYYFEKFPGTPPPPYLREAITLDGVTFDIMLGDEDAKLNVNALYHQLGPVGAEKAIQSVVGPDLGRLVRLIPAVEPQAIAREQRKMSLTADPDGDEDEAGANRSPPSAFDSWGQVFDIGQLNTRFNSDLALPNVTTGLTCWGSGQLNFRRASDEAILANLGAVVQDGGAKRILLRYRKNPEATLQILLQLEVRNDDLRRRASQLLNESSTNFSIWISASAKMNRSATEFMVARRDSEGVTRFSKFAH